MINAEEAIIEYLNTALSGVSAYADVPTERPSSFVTVEATGGSSTLFVSTPMLAVQCWASTRYEASELAREVHGLLPDAAEVRGNGIAHVVVGAPYNFPDEAQARYQIIVDVYTV